MKKRNLLAILSGIIIALTMSCVFQQKQLINPVFAKSNTLTISAAISLKDALNDVRAEYQKKVTKTTITYNFGSSGSLQQQIEQGAPVDIFISAANKQMDTLERKNLLLPSSRRVLVKNQLVLITPKTEKMIDQFTDLTKPTVIKVAFGEPKSVPAGQYGEEVLRFYKILDQVRSKIIYGKDVRQILAYVETGNVNGGLVYLTDAKASSQVRIAAIAPKESHAPIIYPIAILKDTKNLDAAKAFDKFLRTNYSKDVFKKYGFGI
jgi:molybdate transport system substrate-binding protein